ncbi:MAG: KpsF/GutQ family sugar-phosphate isomerase [Bacteroidales bacterium]|nr:KpsF/GutQ family sugar-phosphate isomerase [Bacteroidales bacterium]MBR4714774.1 KpsF/GutQ family sugar-phosphate isomerase [Bacteroidales bacterium]MCR4931366.1 KpsF/GutQ family sugar-phosphate isomerase [Bacteroidales bacterium]
MKTPDEIKHIAIQVIEDEKKAIDQLAGNIDDAFVKAVETLFLTNGRVIITGIGKSANIATKIVSTFNSTGTPAIFMHAADAIHGDLGMVQKDDVVICISKSGNTPEIKVLTPLIKNFGNTLIAIVGNTESFLASQADIVLNATVDHEACPNNLAPTSSTTAQLVMGDAIAVALMECRNFSARDFARFHPGGVLGKRLYMRVSDLCQRNERPAVRPDASLRDTVLEMTSKMLGCTVVMDNDKILGIVCDGDLRRMMKKHKNLDNLTADDIMSPNPKTISANEYAIKALNIMRANSITQLIVVDDEGKYISVLHIHDILREGII